MSFYCAVWRVYEQGGKTAFRTPSPTAADGRNSLKDLEMKPGTGVIRGKSTGYRVDNIPGPMRPFYLAIMWAIGLILYCYYLLCRLTSQISIQGPGDHDLSGHAVYCLWHESWWTYFVVFLRYPSAHALMSHPAAYMKPVHALFQLMGIKHLLLGSSGEEGRKAANEVAQLVRNGYSTTLSPDGPYGPARILKKGVLHIALQSGVPVVPLTISSARFISWPSWDSKKFPLPFNRITVTVHEHTSVNRSNFDEARARIANALGSPDREESANSSPSWERI